MPDDVWISIPLSEKWIFSIVDSPFKQLGDFYYKDNEGNYKNLIVIKNPLNKLQLICCSKVYYLSSTNLQD